MARSVNSPEDDGVAITVKASDRTLSARVASRERWRSDLRSLLNNARQRFGDVAWSNDEGRETVWAHKAILYARSTAPFQARYLGAHVTSPNPSAASSLSLLVPGLDRATPRSPSPGANTLASIETIRSPLILPPTDFAMIKPALEFLYTGRGMADAFSFLFEDSLARSIDPKNPDPAACEQKLTEDLLYMWRSKLFADIQIQIVPDGSSPKVDVDEAVIFTTHRFLLCSRSKYFSTLLLGPYSDSTSRLLTLPSSAFTPASLHFILGAMYCGELDFVPRTFDLQVAIDIWRGAQYLGIEWIREEAECRICDMCHGFRPGSDKLVAKRAAKVLLFSSQPQVRCVRLKQASRRVVVRSFGEAWGKDVGELSDRDRADIAEDAALAVDPRSCMSALSSVICVKSRLANERSEWAERVKAMADVVEKRISKLLKTELGSVVDSPSFVALLEGHLFTLNREVLTSALEMIVAGLSDSNAATAYEVVVGKVLLREDGLPMDARVLLEDARLGIIKFLKRRWVSIRALDGFGKLEAWAVKEIADEIEQTVKDLVSPAFEVEAPVSRTGLRATLGKRKSQPGPDGDSLSLRASVLNRNAAKSSVSPKSAASVLPRSNVTPSRPATVKRSSPTSRERLRTSSASSATSSPEISRQLNGISPTSVDISTTSTIPSPPPPTRPPPPVPTVQAESSNGGRNSLSPKSPGLAPPRRPSSAASTASTSTTPRTPRTSNASPSAAESSGITIKTVPAKKAVRAQNLGRPPSAHSIAATVRSTAPSVRSVAASIRSTAPSVRSTAPSVKSTAPSVRSTATSVRTTRTTAGKTSVPPNAVPVVNGRTPPQHIPSKSPGAPLAPQNKKPLPKSSAKELASIPASKTSVKRPASVTSVKSTRSSPTTATAKTTLRTKASTSSLRNGKAPCQEPPMPGTQLRVPLPALIAFDNGFKGRAAVRFIGATKFAEGNWVGVEVADEKDRANAGEFADWTDGSRGGVKYFDSASKRALFVRPAQVLYVL